MSPADKEIVLEMMKKLWPDESGFKENFEDTIFVYDTPAQAGENGRVGGFISARVRPYVDGAENSPTPHVEGWFVEEDLRKKGVGGELMKAVENWAREQGFKELTSDILADNKVSETAHKALGFKSTELIQYFRKELK